MWLVLSLIFIYELYLLTHTLSLFLFSLSLIAHHNVEDQLRYDKLRDRMARARTRGGDTSTETETTMPDAKEGTDEAPQGKSAE